MTDNKDDVSSSPLSWSDFSDPDKNNSASANDSSSEDFYLPPDSALDPEETKESSGGSSPSWETPIDGLNVFDDAKGVIEPPKESGSADAGSADAAGSAAPADDDAGIVFGNGWKTNDNPEPEPETEAPRKTAPSAGAEGDVFSPGGWGDPGDKKGSADIVFLIDVTGSMTPCIDALKNSIKTFLNDLVRGTETIEPTQNWRVRIVGYRDYPYDHERSYGWICDHSFTRDPDVVVQQIDDLKARGGGISLDGENDPESLLDAIQYVLDDGEMDDTKQDGDKRWRSHAIASRILVIFTDAPFHETLSTPEHAGETFDAVADRLIAFSMHGFMFVPNIQQYADTFSELPSFVITECGEGADGLAGTMSDQEKLRHILVRLQQGISKSASVYP